MNASRKRPLVWVLIAVLLTATGGCRRPIARTDLSVTVPPAFSQTGESPLQEKWWCAFGDEQLNALIERALSDNFGLATAWDRLAQAEAIYRQSDAPLWPAVDLKAGAARTRREGSSGSSTSSLYSVGVAAGYEVDLWSAVRSYREAARLDVLAQREAVDTAAITLAASIAETWFLLAEAKALVEIADQQIVANQHVLAVVTVKFRKNQAAAADVLRQRQLVAATQAQRIVARETETLLQYQLSVLIGAEPRPAWQEAQIDLADLPPTPAVGIPAEALWRRPDVRGAYRQVQAADRRLAVAVADQYPRLSLSASIETSSVSLRDLFDDWLASIAANAAQPLFDGARRRAEVERRQAVVSEAIHGWRETILMAIEDVEAAMTQEAHQRQLLESVELQLRLAEQSYERIRQRYIKGQTEYIRVLESLQSLQGLQRDFARARRELLGRRVDLYRSIAGGWDLPRPTLARIDSAEPTETRQLDSKPQP